MTNEKKVPKLRFPGFTDAWEQREFRISFTGLQNNTLSRADLNDEYGVAQNIHYGDVLIKYGEYIDASKTNLPYITDTDVVNKFYKSFLQDGDIIFADTAEDETVGKCCEIVCSKGKTLIAGLHTMAFRPNEKYASKFLGYYLNSSSYHDQLRPLMQGIKVTSLSKSAMQNTVMIVPRSIEEQEKIGEYFSNLDSIITLQQRKCDNLKKLKKCLLQKMFPKNGSNFPELRFPGFTDAWEQRKLSEIATDISAGGDVDKTILKGSGNYPVIANALINDGIVGYYDNYFRIEAPALTVTGRGDVGHAKARTVNFTPVVRLLSLKSEHDVFFLENAINTLQVIVESTGVPQLTVPQLGNYKIYIPLSIDEEIKIGNFLTKIDNLITLQLRKLESMKQLKKGLLQQMFV